MRPDDGQPASAAFVAVVRLVPRGCVATYGQIAALAGRPGAARAVGAALRSLPPSVRVPWHRVVSAPGRIAPALLECETGARQRRLLRREGVAVDARGRIDLGRFGLHVELGRARA